MSRLSSLRTPSLPSKHFLHPILWTLLFGLVTIGASYDYLNERIFAIPNLSPEAPTKTKKVPQKIRPNRFPDLLALFPSATRFNPKDIDLLARTIYGEARGEASDKAREAVAHVILNRMRDESGRWPKTIAEVVRQKNQFSCWNNNDPNYPLIKNVTFKDPDFRKAYQIALKAISSGDSVRGANHFHTTYVRPTWAQTSQAIQRITQINQHVFYKI